MKNYKLPRIDKYVTLMAYDESTGDIFINFSDESKTFQVPGVSEDSMLKILHALREFSNNTHTMKDVKNLFMGYTMVPLGYKLTDVEGCLDNASLSTPPLTVTSDIPPQYLDFSAIKETISVVRELNPKFLFECMFHVTLKEAERPKTFPCYILSETANDLQEKFQNAVDSGKFESFKIQSCYLISAKIIAKTVFTEVFPMLLT